MAVIRMYPVRTAARDMIQYVTDARKTESGIFVTACNCAAADAADRMEQTKERFGQRTGIEAHHLLLTYLPDEIKLSEAHLLAVELMRRLLPEYEAVAATHTDRDFVHTHIVFSPVNLNTGKRYRTWNRVFVRRIRAELERIDSEHALKLNFQAGNRHQPYYKWYLRENGILPGQEMLLKDAGECLTCALSLEDFYDLMRSAGYTVTINEDRPLFQIPGMQKPCFLTRGGKPLGEEDLRRIISDYLNSPELPPLPERPALPPRPERIDTLPELYRYWADLIRFVGKGGISPFPEIGYSEVSNLKHCETRARFIQEHGIQTVEELLSFRGEQSEKLLETRKQLEAMQNEARRKKKLYQALDTIDRAKDVYGTDTAEAAKDPAVRKAEKRLNGADPDTLWTQRIELMKKRKTVRAENYRLCGIIRRIDYILQEIEAIDRKADHPFTGEGLKGRERSNERKQRHADREDHERT